MAKCPKCHKEIKSLLEEETRTTKCRVQLRDGKCRSLWYDDEKDVGVEQTFDCPECYATLQLCSEEDVAAFLNGDLILDES